MKNKKFIMTFLNLLLLLLFVNFPYECLSRFSNYFDHNQICDLGISVKEAYASGIDDNNLRKSAVVEVAKEASPAVVNISTEEIIKKNVNPFNNFQDPFFERFFGMFPQQQDLKRQNLGSGVIISPNGYIVTNEHVVFRASKITVLLSDSRSFEGKLIGSDSHSDLAVVKIPSDGSLPTIKVGTSKDLMVGETVIAIGNPFGLSQTVTTGVVSALNRSIKVESDRIYNDFIQTDASINPGNSGGPLLNILGELIGINTAIHGNAEGIGFAIPVDKATAVVDNLIRYGHVIKTWLGLIVQDNPSYNKKPGVIIKRVLPGSPADKAMLASQDLIISIGGKTITDKTDYFRRIADFTEGSKIQVAVWRGNQQKEFELVLEAFPKEHVADILYYSIGFKIEPNNPQLTRRWNLSSADGLVINEIASNSQAAGIGLKPGDIIRQINNFTVNNIEDLQQAFLASPEPLSMALLVQRGPYGYWITVEP